MGHYDAEEFEKVNPENFKSKPRLPRWEAEPDYGLRRERPAAAPGGGAPPINFPGMAGRRALAEGLDGLPLVKPPYGVMASIDLSNGTLRWQLPHGDTPDAVRNHPLLKGMNIPKTGQSGSVGVLITKTLVIAGDPQPTAPPGRARGAMRAYNKDTGAQVGEVLLPAPIVGHPMTYSLDGRQYIVVGVSGGYYTGEYISLRLPQTETTTTAPRQ